MKLKIYYRSPVITNIILFIMFSFIFLYIQYLFLNVSSILNVEMYKTFLRNNVFVLVYFIFSAMMVLQIRKFAGLLFSGVVLLTSIMTALNLVTQFSKINLIILFFYLLIAYYIYQFYKLECVEAYYKTNQESNILFDPMLKRVNCSVISETKIVGNGYLTNWSQEACFIALEKKIDKARLKKCQIKVEFEGATFVQDFEVVSMTKNKLGIGLRKKSTRNLDEKNSTVLGWDHFYEIMNEMGLSSELLV